MLTLLLIISITCIIIGFIFDDGFDGLLTSVGIVCAVPIITIILWLSISLVDLTVIDEKIELYSNQNKDIENKVEVVVKQYMEHENKTFTELKTDESYITLVTLYPDLKSDKLIENEIKLYEENNKKITELKEQKINGKIYKWWIYFGK